ncbi:type II secretion system protein F [bacterium BMS3Abin15]|nr:type II secretion system protein F [bacterium BMS3Abin15]HDZ85086.1 type II secretion system F family protein [Candidatus Moranbacteria bacterium]
MPKFIYTAKSYSGETKGGEMIAKDEKSLAHQLKADGFLVTSIKRIKEETSTGSNIKLLDFFNKVPLKEKMMFARNLSVMIAAGVTINRAIDNLSFQTKNKKFKKVLASINEELKSGKALSDGLAKHPGTFSNLFVSMVRVGEVSGNLEEILKIVATQLEKEHELSSKVKGAMVYPAVILVAMIGVAILMLTYILPKITGVFEDMEVTLPGTTLFIMSMSDFLKNHSVLVIIAFVFLAVFLRVFSRTEIGRKTFGILMINIPVIKNLVIKINCARFSRIYSSLLKSGVSVVDSLKIVSDTLSNYYYKKKINEGIEKVQKGIPMSKILSENTSIFPPLVSQMVEVGEETGKTEAVLLKLAEFYEDEVDQITKNLSSIIEPILMLIIGGAVGFFAVAMLQPMYSVLENI